jgi:hypothetical protein
MAARFFILPAAVLLLSACGQSSPPPPELKPVASVKELMHAVIDRAADGLWGSVGTIIDEKGTEERYPRTQEEWDVVRDDAMALVESGNLLMMPGRQMPEGELELDEEWIRLSQALMDVSMKAVKAADAKDKDAVFNVGGDIYAVCSNCHQKYAPDIRRVGD